MLDLNQETGFLREERSAIGSYFGNFSIKPKETREYKKLAKQLAGLVALKTKLEVLTLEKDMLSFNQELMSMVGGNIDSYKDKWSKKHAQFLKETKNYEKAKKKYLG